MNKEICILNGTKWILGDESTEPMNWEDANNWCKSIGQDLPPREVLLMAFLNPEIRSNFANNYYWSSSEFDSYSAWDQDFNIGDQNVNFSKSAKLSVRAVRAIIAEASEQTEQEPVAWIIETEIHGKLSEWVCTDKKHYLEAHDSIKEPIPLYLAPPKRKPLTPQQISEGNQSMLNVTREAFKQGVIFAEKAHGIGGEI
jgi:hypothetical protein